MNRPLPSQAAAVGCGAVVGASVAPWVEKSAGVALGATVFLTGGGSLVAGDFARVDVSVELGVAVFSGTDVAVVQAVRAARMTVGAVRDSFGAHGCVPGPLTVCRP